MAQQDWEEFSAYEADSYLDLQRLYESLQEQIIELIDKLDNFRISPEYVLYEKCNKQPDLFDKILYEYRAELTEEIASLEKELAEIESELERLLS